MSAYCGICFLIMSIGPVGYFFIRVIFFGLPTGLIMLICCAPPMSVTGGILIWRGIVGIQGTRGELSYSTHDQSSSNRHAIDSMPVAQVVSLDIEGGNQYSAPQVMVPGDRIGLDAPMLSPVDNEHEVL